MKRYISNACRDSRHEHCPGTHPVTEARCSCEHHTPDTVEKAARAVAEASDHSWDGMAEVTRANYRRLATAALSVVPAATPDDGRHCDRCLHVKSVEDPTFDIEAATRAAAGAAPDGSPGTE